MISPFLKSLSGNCQDASILVEVTALTLKFSGAPVGAKETQLNDNCINTVLYTRSNYSRSLTGSYL